MLMKLAKIFVENWNQSTPLFSNLYKFMVWPLSNIHFNLYLMFLIWPLNWL